jgi:hypothetical protein
VGIRASKVREADTIPPETDLRDSLQDRVFTRRQMEAEAEVHTLYGTEG